MNQTFKPSDPTAMQPVLARLRSLGGCSDALEAQVLALSGRTQAIPVRTVVWSDDSPVHRPQFLIAGWACRYLHLSDGRRQIFDIVLPGDGIGWNPKSLPQVGRRIVALTPLRLVDASALAQGNHEVDGVRLDRALADADEERALRQIVRLGRMTALERLADLFTELHERLERVGQTDGTRFAFPLTQETLADLTGLSVVHVNRTIQELRRRGLITIERGWVRISDAVRPSELTKTSTRRLAG